MYSKKVREFNEACDVNKSQGPVKMDVKSIGFLKEMVNDELEELEDAKTVSKQADALVDAIYYIFSEAVKHGINLDKIFDIVHNSNMSKVVDGKVTKGLYGKILKPEGWVDPDPLIKKEIERQLQTGGFNDDF